MSKLYRNLALLIIISLAIMFFGFFLISLFTFPGKNFLTSFKSQWITAHTVISFFEYMLPVITALLLLGFSYFYAGKKYFGGYSMSGIVSRALILFLFLGAAYTVFQEGIVPRQNQKLELLKYRSEIAKSFLDIYDDAFNKADYKKSEEYIKLYLSLDPGNIEAEQKLAAIEEITRNRKMAEKEMALENQEKMDAAKRNEQLRSLHDAADVAFKRMQYFKAAYLANLILDLDSNDEQAKILLASSWQEITNTDFTDEELEMQKFYKAKKNAFQTLYREKNPIKAYYLLRELKETHPDDKDVENFYHKAYEEMQALSFFIEDAERILSFEGYDDIYFINRLNDNMVQLIRIEKMSVVDQGVFCKNIEIIYFSFDDDTVYYHVNYPYGKIYHNELIVKAVSKSKPGTVVKPLIFSSSKSIPYPDISLTLAFSVRELPELSRQRLSLSRLSAARLLDLKKLLTSAGYPLDSVDINIISRLQRPIIFIQICFASLLLGLVFRLKDTNKTRFVYILFVPVPFLLSLLAVKIVMYCSRIITGLLYFISNYTVTLFLLVAVHLVILLIILIILAGQNVEEK